MLIPEHGRLGLFGFDGRACCLGSELAQYGVRNAPRDRENFLKTFTVR